MTTGTGQWTSSSRTSTTSGVRNEAGGETEDLKRAVMTKTVDGHQQDINDSRVLGTRLGGTKAMKRTVDNHQQDINDPRVLGMRLGGTKTMKRTLDPGQKYCICAWEAKNLPKVPGKYTLEMFFGYFNDNFHCCFTSTLNDVSYMKPLCSSPYTERQVIPELHLLLYLIIHSL